MSLFEKCHKFYNNSDFARTIGYPVNPRMAEALGLYPYFLPIEQTEGSTIMLDGQELIMLGSNNYLGLADDPRLKEASCKAIQNYGTGCTGSRFLNGTLELHLELEERLARLVGKEKALVFSTGYQTNLGVLTALAGKGDIIICDKKVHASIIDAARLAKEQARASMRFFKHRDVESLAHILQQYGEETNKLVVTDGVFSMEGDISPLPDICEITRKYGADLLVDDAHGIGVLGNGMGTAAYFNCTDQVDLIVGTFSKSFGSMGGFVAGSKEVIHWIQHRARSYIFSASLSPSNVAAVLAALDIMEMEPERIKRVNTIAQKMREELSGLGYNIGASETPIVPIIIGDPFKTMQAWEALIREGIYTNVALPPAVNKSECLLRTSYMAIHTDQQLENILSVFSRLKQKFPITGETAETKKVTD